MTQPTTQIYSNPDVPVQLQPRDTNSIIKMSIAQKRLSKSHYSFNLAMRDIAVSFYISLARGGLILLYKVVERTVTFASGFSSIEQRLQFNTS